MGVVIYMVEESDAPTAEYKTTNKTYHESIKIYHFVRRDCLVFL